MTARAVVGGFGDGFLDNATHHASRCREVDGFDVVVVGADIADMRESEGHDLAGVGRIGENFLIAGHGGVETHLSHRLALGTHAKAFDHCAVGQHQKAGDARRLPVA